MQELFELLRELFKENPPVIASEKGLLEGGGGGGGGAARKREWVAQRVAELSEVVGCMVIAGYYRYSVSAAVRMQGLPWPLLLWRNGFGAGWVPP